MLDKKNLIALAKQVARADRTAPVSYSFGGNDFSYEELNETLRKELREYAGTNALYRQHKNLIFEVIEQAIDDIQPKRAEQAYMQFAEVKQFAQGDKPLFRRKKDVRMRAKQFVTRGTLAGKYEVFKLGYGEDESFEVPTNAIVGAAQIGFEEFLDGRADFAELIDVIMTGMDDLLFKEVAHSLKAAVNQLPPANIVMATGFDEEEFDRLLVIASAYGTPTIYCNYEFAVKMVPEQGWRYTEKMKQELWDTGHLATYKGRTVVILPDGIEDETNTRRSVDPGYCYIIPTGADPKPVKIAFEGDTNVRERENDDWSREIQVYRKCGVTTMLANNICAYCDLSLAGNYDLKGTHWDSSAFIDMAYPTKEAT